MSLCTFASNSLILGANIRCKCVDLYVNIRSTTNFPSVRTYPFDNPFCCSISCLRSRRILRYLNISINFSIKPSSIVGVCSLLSDLYSACFLKTSGLKNQLCRVECNFFRSGFLSAKMCALPMTVIISLLMFCGCSANKNERLDPKSPFSNS